MFKLIIKTFILVFSFFTGTISQAIVTEIVLENQEIRITYNATQEFNTQQFSLAIREKMNTAIELAIDDSFTLHINAHIMLPKCRLVDQICIQYVTWVNNQFQKVIGIFDQYGRLTFNLYIAETELQIREDNIAYIKQNIEKEHELQEKIYEFQVFLQTIMNNQATLDQFFTSFEKYHTESTNKEMNIMEWIADAKAWTSRNSDTTVFRRFLDNIENQYKDIDNLHNGFFSHIQTSLLHYNPNVLQNFFHFITQIQVDSNLYARELNERLKTKNRELNKLYEEYWSIEATMNTLWDNIGNQSKKLTYPNSSSGSFIGGGPSCGGCLQP